ncbi:PREDICTED: probable thiopurine S-methyltransferase isoform X2 [Amphimedon queenslandica]|uniref:thiopurine S-methyltransferase n=1 Tax=Amphimedon queenslandica TaxID=400682 RepID=A0AAN0IXX2_AMPQE|nr:PREDICTED: probable thiopurine S-methyltransferase isoform X2 [Amphimedon queenslandica]|eukprot:XP_019849402.1 PREDICTED: probable thiopurine S-methyltransferase isoform X2 [Amphimedon queenslandica]
MKLIPLLQCIIRQKVHSSVLSPLGVPRIKPVSTARRSLVFVSRPQNKYEDSSYWNIRWTGGTTIWHKWEVDELLKKHYHFLQTGNNQSSIFVPLCGKSIDMKWLADKGHAVVGIDIVELAAQQFFTESNIPFKKLYESTDDMMKIKFIVGDLFKCSVERIGSFDAIWDCNSIIAINPDDTKRYAKLLDSLLKSSGRILLSTYEFEDLSGRDQPPHNLPPDAVKGLFGEKYSIAVKETLDHTALFCIKYQIPWAQRHLLYLSKNN